MKSLVLFLLFTASFFFLNAQNSNWKKNIRQNFFVENHRQEKGDGENEVLYYTQLGNSKILFKKNGIVIERYSDNTGSKRRGRKQRKKIIRTQWEIIFENCTNKIETIPNDIQSHVFITTNNLGINTRSATYNSITYTNVWENIDIKFYLPKEGGVKYDLILHPNADADNISLKYHDINSLALDTNNNLLIQANDYNYKDLAPVAFIDEGNEVKVKYVVDGNSVKMLVDNYDSSKKLIIDPWLLNFGFFESGFDLEYDNENNVYVSTSSFVASNIYKYDIDGNLLWTYNVPDLLSVSDITINRFTQELFFSIGQVFTNIGDLLVVKLDESGNQIQTYNYIANAPEELWRMKYDHCNDQLVFGTGGESYVFQGGTLSLDFDFMIGENILDVVDEGNHDVNNLVFDPDGQSCYMLVSSTAIYPTFDNILFKANLPDLSITHWDTYSTHEFTENGTPFGLSGGSFNGIACGWDFLYTYDGSRLIQWDKENGNLINEVTVGVNLEPSAGILVTPCGDIYIGVENSIFVFDNNLNQTNTIDLDGICFDLILGKDYTVYATGGGFIEAFSLDIPPYEVFSESDVCGQGVGSASIMPCNTLNDVDVLWTPSGQTTLEATNLMEGWHTVSIVGNNCYEANSIQDSIYISNIDDCELTITLNEETICEGTCYELIANVISGTPPYTFSWDNGVNQDNTESTTVCPTETTVYTATVTDDVGDVASVSVTIEVVPVPIINLGNDTLLCTATSLTLLVNEPTYDYLWFDNSVGNSVEVSSSGTYWVTATNNGCSVSDSIDVTILSSAGLPADTTLCENEFLTLSLDNFDTYQWSTGEQESSISISQSGIYWVNAMSQGCNYIDSIIVTFSNPTAFFLSDLTTGCSPLEITFIDQSEGEIESWNWSFGNGLTSSIEDPASVIYDTSGSFDVSLEITDQHGCTDINSVANYITVHSESIASFDFTTESTFLINEPIYFNNLTSDVTSSVWDFGDGNFSSELNPSHSYEEPGTYTITLEVTNVFGCVSQTSWTVYAEQPLILYVPNSFTPNNDGVNDFFKPIISGEDPDEYFFEIYNRWGEAIFSTKDVSQGWSGKHRGDNNSLDYYAIDGIYTWIINVKRIGSSDVDTIHGHVTIIR